MQYILVRYFCNAYATRLQPEHLHRGLPFGQSRDHLQRVGVELVPDFQFSFQEIPPQIHPADLLEKDVGVLQIRVVLLQQHGIPGANFHTFHPRVQMVRHLRPGLFEQVRDFFLVALFVGKVVDRVLVVGSGVCV